MRGGVSGSGAEVPCRRPTVVWLAAAGDHCQTRPSLEKYNCCPPRRAAQQAHRCKHVNEWRHDVIGGGSRRHLPEGEGAAGHGELLTMSAQRVVLVAGGRLAATEATRQRPSRLTRASLLCPESWRQR